jgi:hypothetical protein
MSTMTKIALAAVLVLAGASGATAASGGRNGRGIPPAWSYGGSGGFVPGSQAEHEWFERASRPSNM